jgi:hypothetical protein
MVWTDMTAVDERGELLEPRHMRTYYPAYEAAGFEQVCRDVGPIAELCTQVPDQFSNDRVRVGEIYSQMVLGNLVHPPTVLLRRDRACAAGMFDPSLGNVVDYDYLARVCELGPVALIDAPGMLYRVNAGDQLSRPEMTLESARDNLVSLQRILRSGRERISLPEKVLRRRYAGTYAWLGEAELNFGDKSKAVGHLWNSLRYEVNARVATLLVASLLPMGLVQRLRAVKRRLLAAALPVCLADLSDSMLPLAAWLA